MIAYEDFFTLYQECCKTLNATPIARDLTEVVVLLKAVNGTSFTSFRGDLVLSNTHVQGRFYKLMGLYKPPLLYKNLSCPLRTDPIYNGRDSNPLMKPEGVKESILRLVGEI